MDRFKDLNKKRIDLNKPTRKIYKLSYWIVEFQ